MLGLPTRGGMAGWAVFAVVGRREGADGAMLCVVWMLCDGSAFALVAWSRVIVRGHAGGAALQRVDMHKRFCPRSHMHRHVAHGSRPGPVPPEASGTRSHPARPRRRITVELG